MRVLLTGATGFVGKSMIPTLLHNGHNVVCLVRPDSMNKLYLSPVWKGRVCIKPGDIFDLPSLENAAEGCDAVIHLVGIIRENKGKNVTFSHIHVTGTENVVTVAKKENMKHFIFMSALGARENATSMYHQTKYKAEQSVIASGLTYTIFRPSVIFGPGDEFVTMLADLVRLPLTPVIGDGRYLLQPVSHQTVADVFSQALKNPEAKNQTFEVGGPKALTYLEILDEIGAAIHKKQVRKIHIPIPIMKPVVKVMEGFTFFPITNTQLIMLQEGNYCTDAEKLYKVFETDKIPFSKGIRSYLS